MEQEQETSQSTYGLRKVSGCFVVWVTESRVLGPAASGDFEVISKEPGE